MPECRSPFDKLLVYDVSTTSGTVCLSGVGMRRHSGIHASVPHYEPGDESYA